MNSSVQSGLYFIAKSCVYTQTPPSTLISVWRATVGRMNSAAGLIKLKSNKAFCKCANPLGGPFVNSLMMLQSKRVRREVSGRLWSKSTRVKN